ncbi:exosome complex exonuclease RRP42-like [Ptychodera flava]|uniref:exosome complex exonuclease RRP42-like n=1 Tax=Ptychodera flava TaxID=63121 RepID=UPI00396A0D40
MASVLLSEAQKTFIAHGIQDGLRTDGRSCEEYRIMELQCDVVSNTSGSARLKLSNTDILVGIKAEMGTPKPERPDEGYLEFFVDCSANAAPEFEGRGGDDLATEISNTIQRIYDNKKAVDLKSLCIMPRETCWVIYIDVVILECGGNLFDAVSVAIKAALHNTRIPNVTVSMDDEGQREIELSDDPHDCYRIDTRNIPCLVTVSKVGNRHIVDATMEEEACCLACLMVAVTPKGTFSGVRKEGSGSLDPESVFEMMESAKKVGVAVNRSLNTLLERLEKEPNKSYTCFLD